MTCMAKSRTIKQRVFIKAPPSKVFKAITEPHLLKRWFIASAKLSPRKGGNFSFEWQGGYTLSGKVLDYARDRKLSLSWRHGKEEERPLGITRVSFKLKPKEDGTILELTHSGYKSGNPWIEEYAEHSSGWAYYLTNLKSVLQHNRDLRSPLDWI
jgi:uncharacterized protein YndB with AHSA1/START domain